MIRQNRSYWSFLKTDTVTVRVQPRSNTPREIYKVTNVIDTGVVDMGGSDQKVMLEHQGYVLKAQSGALKFDVSLPMRVDGLRLLYSGRRKKLSRNINALLGADHDTTFEQIVPDVVQPGDILVFSKCPRRAQITIVKAYRPIAASQRVAVNKRQTSYAL